MIDSVLGFIVWYRKKRRGIWIKMSRTSSYDNLTIIYWIRVRDNTQLLNMFDDDPAYSRIDYLYKVLEIETQYE